MRDVMGHKLHKGDIAIASIQNSQVVVRVLAIEEHPDYSHKVAKVSLLAYAKGKTPLIKFFPGSRLIWYSSDYRKIPDQYMVDLLVHESRHPHA